MSRMNFFDFNGDGKTSSFERHLAYKIFKECLKEEEEERYDPLSDEDKYEWRLYCEDGYEFGVSPYDYETLEDYEEDLHEAKYGWRDFVEIDYDIDVDPEDYETQEEYEDAVEEEKYGWRDLCFGWGKYEVDPEDYETEEEYDEALEEAMEKYGWRGDCEDGSNFGIDYMDFETLEDYEEALHEAKYGWRDNVSIDYDLGVLPEDFETLDEYNEKVNLLKKPATLPEAELENLEIRNNFKPLDTTVYTVCGVLFPRSIMPYSYLTEDDSIQLGDKVKVPVGDNNDASEGVVVSIGKYYQSGLMWPLEKTKWILGKVDLKPDVSFKI